MEQLQTPTMEITIKKSTTIETPPYNGQLPEPHGGGGWGLNAFYRYQLFALDSAVVEVQEMFSSHGSLLTNAMVSPWSNTLIKLTNYEETKKRAHDSQIVRGKENLKLIHGGSSYR